jgi:hypothetical protein
VDAVKKVASALGLLGESQLPDRFQLEDELLEPELIGLMDDDEKQLVVGGRI